MTNFYYAKNKCFVGANKAREVNYPFALSLSKGREHGSLLQHPTIVQADATSLSPSANHLHRLARPASQQSASTP
jgi:hypothetical protein